MTHSKSKVDMWNTMNCSSQKCFLNNIKIDLQFTFNINIDTSQVEIHTVSIVAADGPRHQVPGQQQE